MEEAEGRCHDANRNNNYNNIFHILGIGLPSVSSMVVVMIQGVQNRDNKIYRCLGQYDGGGDYHNSYSCVGHDLHYTAFPVLFCSLFFLLINSINIRYSYHLAVLYN